MKRPICLGALLLACFCVSAQGARISNVTKIGGDAAETPTIVPMSEGVEAYTDRTHILVNVPEGLINDGDIPDFVQLSNDDKTANPLEHQVTLNQLSLLYVGLDDRIETQPLAWMNDTGKTGLPSGFFDTGAQVDIDESADGSINQTFSLWATLAPAGTYSLLEQNDGGGRNMYVVFADNKLVPEPSALALFGFAFAGLLGYARRR